MPYTCLVTRQAIGKDFYVLPFILNELSTLENIRKYSHPLSKNINIDNELYRIALLPIKAYFDANHIPILIENDASRFFQEKTGKSMQILLDDVVGNTQKLSDIYFSSTNNRNRLDRNIFASFIDAKVFDGLLTNFSKSKTLWEDVLFIDKSFFDNLGFCGEPDQGSITYTNEKDRDIKIVSLEGHVFLRHKNKDYDFKSIQELEKILNDNNKTLGKKSIAFTKKTKNEKWMNLSLLEFDRSWPDISESFYTFYGESIYKLIDEYSRLTEILTILDSANIMLDKPKHVPDVEGNKYIKDMQRFLLDI